jgi:hypothetical protein
VWKVVVVVKMPLQGWKQPLTFLLQSRPSQMLALPLLKSGLGCHQCWFGLFADIPAILFLLA